MFQLPTPQHDNRLKVLRRETGIKLVNKSTRVFFLQFTCCGN